MQEEIEVRAYISGYADGTITREEVIREYHHQLELVAHMPGEFSKREIASRIADKILNDIATYDTNGIEIDEVEWWDENEVINCIEEYIDSIGDYEEAPDGQLVLFDPAPYEKSMYDINLEEYNRFYELRKETENKKKSLDKS